MISAVLNEEPPPISATVEGLSSGLDRIVRRCLEKDQEARFHSALDLAFALRESAVLPAAIQATGTRPPPDRATTLYRWLFLGALALIGGGLVIAITSRAEMSRRWLTRGPDRIASLAVLPLTDLTGDPGQQYFVTA
jgi:hypothetical protein